MPLRRLWLGLLAMGVLVLATRLPIAPGQLLTYDDVNLAYSVGHFDVRMSQPQPPGYPLFVMEMRLLYWLRFRRAEHMLLALGLAGTFAALVLMAVCGNRIMGGRAGWYAACLLLLQPVFWQTGVVSALRMQLAVISLAVAGSCWRAWQGEKKWVMWSAVALAIGAGIRPETGPLLFPLWAASALRAPATWKERGRGLAVMAGLVLLWLVPTVIASGGPLSYLKTNLSYVSDQASVSSELFGATEAKARTAFWRLLVWTMYGITGFTMQLALAWRQRDGWGVRLATAAFLLLWFAPSFVFALAVHIEDPGQVLAMVPVISLFGGFLTDRALDNLDVWISRWHALTLSAATVTVAWIIWFHYAWFILLWVPVVALITGVLLRAALTKNFGNPPRTAMCAFLFSPALILNVTAFNHEGWYYQGARTDGLDQVLADVNSGLHWMSRQQVDNTLAMDDHAIRQLMRLSAERPGNTVVIFEEGMTTWRKAAYYVPGVPVIVLEHKLGHPGSPPLVSIWRGNHHDMYTEGRAPLRVSIPAGARIVWLLNPNTEFYALVTRAFTLAPADPVYYSDLPRESGSRLVGEYELAW